MPDLSAAPELVRVACFAADFEVMKPPPWSTVRRPDGGRQYETRAEFTRRIVEAGVMHLIEQGLLLIPDDIDARLDRGVLMERPPAAVSPPGPEAAPPEG